MLNRRASRSAPTLAVLAAAALVAGCYETADVTVHEPGEYKGNQDPLTKQQATARAEQLRKRFELVQIDR